MAKKLSMSRIKKLRKQQVSLFAPLLSRSEKETVKHLSQHDAVVFLRARRLGITVAEYKFKYCK